MTDISDARINITYDSDILNIASDELEHLSQERAMQYAKS